MTLQQLEYILALDKTRHFVRAAEICGVTQPTLSAMVQKLEDELDCIIFDRSQHPITPTSIGRQIIDQANVIVFHSKQLCEIIEAERNEVTGALHIAVIPTIAPYLLPKFIQTFKSEYPCVTLTISEMRTADIVERLKSAEIDIAILATPLDGNNTFLEVPLYYEKFVAYVSPTDPLFMQSQLSAKQLPLERIWILEEGHCLRNQIFNFCDDQKNPHVATYEAGSIDTLVKIVDTNGGYTVIPELHIDFLNETQKKNLRDLAHPEATREISVVIRNDFVKEGILNAVTNTVKKIIPEHMVDSRLKKFAVRL